MEKHAKAKHNNLIARKKYCCIFCGVEYLGRQCLQRHVKGKHGQEAHFCPRSNCGRYYKTEAEVQRHVKEFHECAPTDDKVPCIICNHRISSRR